MTKAERMEKNYPRGYVVDFQQATITITEKFGEKASVPTNKEYKLLVQLKQDLGFRINYAS